MNEVIKEMGFKKAFDFEDHITYIRRESNKAYYDQIKTYHDLVKAKTINEVWHVRGEGTFARVYK